MPSYDFDFQRYIERKKGAREAEAREGSVYAYSGELRLRRLLLRLRPVALALEATVRLWRATARAEVLGTAVRASDRSYPRVHAAAVAAAQALHVTLPAVSVSPALTVASGCFGTDDEPQVLLHAALAETLGDDELRFVLGAGIGHVQNRHALPLTAIHFLDRWRGTLSRLAAAPARAALSAFRRRALITGDRAGLLACQDLAVAASALARLSALDAELGYAGDEATLSSSLRVRALEVFTRGAYYRGAAGTTGAGTGPGISSDDADAQVAALLKSGGDDPSAATGDDAEGDKPRGGDPERPAR